MKLVSYRARFELAGGGRLTIGVRAVSAAQVREWADAVYSDGRRLVAVRRSDYHEPRIAGREIREAQEATEGGADVLG